MITKILVRLFGGMWKLKGICNTTQNKFLRKYLIKLYRDYQYAKGCSIAWNSEFDGIPCLPHGLNGIFISATSKIGKNCVIFHQVTVGANTLPDSKKAGAPTIGDNCYIGAGAKIIGNIKVGNNVRVGANCVVYENVPDNCVVVSGSQVTTKKDKTLINRFYYFNQKWFYYDDGKWVEETNQAYLKNIDFCKKAYEI